VHPVLLAIDIATSFPRATCRNCLSAVRSQASLSWSSEHSHRRPEAP